jgi:beta-glucanase (GH16 family)
MKFAFDLLVSVFILISCNKKTGNNNETAPANLVVTANVSTDNSGNVSFTASAVNAVSYDFGFGNGVFQLVPSGIITYRYMASGIYTVNVVAKSAGGQTISKSIQVTVAVTQSMVWSDEFNTTGAPDNAKWGYDIGDGCPSLCGWGNNELQYYTNRTENITVSNGTLKITARAENFGGRSYTSARLLSKDKFSFKYGKAEIRAKLPAGVGTWPAIWMLGNNIGTAGWPSCGEIDIMEHKGSELNKIYSALHYPGNSGGNANSNSRVITNAATEFHVYSLEWSPAEIKLLVDGLPMHSVTNSSNLPFNQNFFFILNVAIGGNFGGPVDPAFTSAAMEIDYIRVYQ